MRTLRAQIQKHQSGKTRQSETITRAVDALEQIRSQLLAAGVSFHSPYAIEGEAVIELATGTRKAFVQVLKDNGFKCAIATPCYDSYTKGSAIIRVYW